VKLEVVRPVVAEVVSVDADGCALTVPFAVAIITSSTVKPLLSMGPRRLSIVAEQPVKPTGVENFAKGRISVKRPNSSAGASTTHSADCLSGAAEVAVVV
jgi:hypothetical protein